MIVQEFHTAIARLAFLVEYQAAVIAQRLKQL